MDLQLRINTKYKVLEGFFLISFSYWTHQFAEYSLSIGQLFYDQ